MIKSNIPWARQPPSETQAGNDDPLTKGLIYLSSFRGPNRVKGDGPLWAFPLDVTDTVMPNGAGKKVKATASNSGVALSSQISAGITVLFVAQKHAKILTNSDFIFGNFINSAGAYDWGLYESSTSGNLFFFLHNGTTAVSVEDTAGWIDNSPVRTYMLTYGSGDNTVRMYRDGLQIASTAQTGNVRQTATTVKMGGWQASTPNFSTSLVGVWNRGLISRDVKLVSEDVSRLYAPLTRRIFVSAAAVSAALTGTIATATEANIVTGGRTIILTLTGDTFLAAGTGPIGSTANTQALINGIDSAQAEATGWDAVVKAGIATTDVVRTSSTVATITLPAFAAYNITATETITASIPAAVLTLAGAVVAAPTFQVTAVSTGGWLNRGYWWGQTYGHMVG